MRIVLPIIILLSLISNALFAQQPGGVNGTRVWYITSKAGKDNYRFIDTSGHQWGYDFAPKGDALNINFHPALYFDGYPKKIEFKNVDFNQATVISILYPDSLSYNDSSTSDFWSIESENNKVSQIYNYVNADNPAGKHSFLYGNKASRTRRSPKSKNILWGNSMRTSVYYKANQKIHTSIWGNDEPISLKLTSAFKGYLPEFIIYNRVLSFEERLTVESYLAIKYGITLDTSYLGRNNKLLWDIKDPELRKFHHRVCAIGRDTLAAIWQPKSNTTYEEGPYYSYGKDADYTKADSKDWNYIPKHDSVSLYRSITIGYCDSSMNMLPEGAFLFWGDDSLSTKEQYYLTDIASYPKMKVMQRTWLMYNPDKITHPTKVVLAGKEYMNQRRSTIFSNLYKPYDYQLYRFVLIKLKNGEPNKVDTAILCDYFGREQNLIGKFNTRAIVWDSILWQETTDYNYFTFGKVPVLNFLQIGKTEKEDSLISLQYPYYLNYPITSETNFDVIDSKRKFTFGENEQVALYFRVSEGVPPLKTKLYKIFNNNRLEEVPNAIFPAGIPIPPNTPQISDPNPIEEFDGPIAIDTTDQTSEEIKRVPIREITRRRSVKKQIYNAFVIPKLERDKTYLIEVTDRIGQKTTLPFKTTTTIIKP